jgi:hypothetical protein
VAEPIEPAEESGPVTTPDGRAYVKLANGSLASVPAEQLESFLNEGRGSLASSVDVARREEEKKYGEGVGNVAATFGESALSGATLGLSDVAARYVAPEYAADLAKRREYNTTAAGLGEATGIIGATLLSGGTGALGGAARVATAPTRGLIALGEAATGATAKVLGTEAATGVLGQAVRTGAGYAVGGATEGALFGAAKSVTDDYLHDHEITAERVIMGAGTGLVWGGALGGGLGFGGSLVAQGGKKVASLWNRTDAEREASKILDDAISADSTGTGTATSDATATGSAGASAEASVGAQTLTTDQRTLLELGHRSDDEVVAELSLSPTPAEQQSAFTKLQQMGAEAAAAKDFKTMQQDYTRSIVGRWNDGVAPVLDRANAFLNRGHKHQTVKDQLDVVMPEWTPEKASVIGSEVSGIRERALKVLNGSRKLSDAEHNALQDVVEAAEHFEKQLVGAKPELMPKAPRDAVTFRIDSDDVRKQLTIRNAEAPEGTQYVLRYLPIDDIDTAGRALKPGPVRELSSKKIAPPVEVRPLESGKYALEDGASRVAAAREAGLTHIPSIVPDNPRMGLMGRADRDAVAEAYMAADDFKGALGRAARKASRGTPQINAVESLLERDYMGVKGALESEDLWGKAVATMQRMTNATESEAIRNARVFERRFVQDEGLQNIRAGQQGFDTLGTLDSGKTGNLISNLGRAENAEAERDFLLGVQRQIDNAKTKAEFYRLPPEMKAEIAQAEKTVQGIISDLRTARATKEMADRYADQVETFRNVPVVGEQLAKLKITTSKALQMAAGLRSDVTSTASGGAVRASTGATAGASGTGAATQHTAAHAAIRAGIKGEGAIASTAKGVVKWLKSAGEATGKAAAKVGKAAKKASEAAPILGVSLATGNPQNYERVIRNIGSLRDPNSDERRVMRGNMFPLRQQSPQLAAALEAHTQRIGDFLAEKAGELYSVPKSGDVFGDKRKPRHDPAKAQKLARYVDAATNPQSALQRIGEGEFLREDIEVLQSLYPRMYQRVRDEVLLALSEVDSLPPYEARLRLGHLLNAPTDPSMRPDRVAGMQAVAKSGAANQQQQQSDDGALPPSRRREPRLASIYQTRTQESPDRM